MLTTTATKAGTTAIGIGDPARSGLRDGESGEPWGRHDPEKIGRLGAHQATAQCVQLDEGTMDQAALVGKLTHQGIRLDRLAVEHQRRKHRKVEVPYPSYQPNAEELCHKLRPRGIFEDAVKALPAPVRICRDMPRKSLR